ncbi:MAG: UDP-N-acetylmuramate--L-alanine ligase [Chloroflexota bacterium]
MHNDSVGRAVLEAKSVHFIGIAGTGMQALAEVLLARGTPVSGSDTRAAPVLDRLSSAGARISIGQACAQLGEADAVVISAAIPDDNPELQEARARHLPVATHAQVLGALSQDFTTIAISGTHGKSTTTALCAHILLTSGLDPIVLGGAYAENFGGSGRAGRGPHLVVEADEFARRFLELTPTVAVITNIEPDHLDYYESFAAIESTFADFVKRLRPDGWLLACADGPMGQAVTQHQRLIRYGETPGADWRISDYAADPHGTSFTLHPPSAQAVQVTSPLRGRHNALNTTAAIGAATLVGVSLSDATASVGSFLGTQRRFQTVLRTQSLWIIDDYAHHPTEIRATLRAARESHAGRIIAVFQPHTSHRTRALFDDFATAFPDADEVLLLPIYHPAGREPENVTVSSVDLASAIRQSRSRSVKSMDEAVEVLRTRVQSGDLVLLMGAGDVTELGPRLAGALGTLS